MLFEPQRAEDPVHQPHRAAQLPAGRREDENVVHEADVEEAGRGHPPVELIEEEGPDQRAQRTAERNPALAIPEPAAAIGGAPQIMAEQVENVGLPDVERQPVHQQQMVDRGVIGLHVAAQHEAVGGERRPDLAHRCLRAAVALDVRAARRDRQHPRQHERQRLEHQRIAGRLSSRQSRRNDQISASAGQARRRWQTQANAASSTSSETRAAVRRG